MQALSARVKFMIRDIVELRKSKWVPRRQKEEAKKISEIHAAAHAELGMIPAAVLPGLAPLPAHSRAAVPGLADDVELFPAFKGDGERLCMQVLQDVSLPHTHQPAKGVHQIGHFVGKAILPTLGTN